MHKPKRKLELARTTIRTLAPSDLAAVAGGTLTTNVSLQVSSICGAPVTGTPQLFTNQCLKWP